jgi:hypothetical protein
MASITTSQKILARMKGLQAQMREGEQPLFTIPVIWENAMEKQTSACDLVLTNQRVFGYIFTSFPRERLFLDALELDSIKAVSIRQKNFDAVFRELFVSDGTKKIYLRATRKKIEDAYTALQATIGKPVQVVQSDVQVTESEPQQAESSPATIFGRQEVKQTLERSPMGITLLLAGGLLLEIIGVLAWAVTGEAQTGLPLCIAGVVAVVVATIARRQLR